MPVGDANVIEILPSAVPGVRRMLLRSDAGAIVEAVELTNDRLAALPAGGMFSAFEVRGPLAILGPPLQRRLAELHPPPLVVLGLLVRLLDDLELLHRGGGAHGALALDGIGVDERGQLVVRPVLHVAQELSALADIRAVGGILAALADRPKLEAAGVARAALLLSGLGVGSPRAGFADARAARQALAVVVRGLRVEDTRDSFLAASGVSLPRPPSGFRSRPVEVVAQASATGSGARAAEARAWLDRSMTELQTARFGREATLDVEAERLSEALRRQTETTLNAARAVAEGEAERLVRSSARPPPAMLFVGAGVRPTMRLAEAPGAALAEEAGDEEEETLDAASADGAALAGLGPESVIEAGGAPDGGDSRAESAYERDAAIRADAVAEAERHREQEARIAAAEAEIAAAAAARHEAERVEGERAAAWDAAEAAAAAAAYAAGVEAERAAAEAARLEAEEAVRIEGEKIEAERAAVERAETERAAAEAARIEAERAAAEAARIEAERAEAEAARIEAERAAAEAARIEAERLEAERPAAEEEEARAAQQAAWTAAEREAAEEAARIVAEEAERSERERAAAEAARAEAARMEAEESARLHAEQSERAAAARADAEAAAAAEAAARIQAERLAAAAAEEAERRERAHAAAAEAARLAAEAERRDAEQRASEAARREAERAEVEDAGHTARKPAPRARASEPEPDPDPEAWPDHPDGVSDDAERGGVARWEGLGGVRGDPARMNEKGPGKWTSQGRSREELAEQLPPGESRPMDMSPPEGEGSRLGIYIAVGGAVALALAWWGFA
ncbi:hypothetical protein LBMAG42_28810 [Deltaproteobacteria bacterium]|nr:hypothetical protein LBMAG42_28810 [Deltaproteobacteria bacterium]